jgi:hypothetical protein
MYAYMRDNVQCVASRALARAPQSRSLYTSLLLLFGIHNIATFRTQRYQYGRPFRRQLSAFYRLRACGTGASAREKLQRNAPPGRRGRPSYRAVESCHRAL